MKSTWCILPLIFRLAVEPHYPQVCVRHGVVKESKKEELSTPMELDAALNSIPCSFAFDREDRISIIHLIAQVSVFHKLVESRQHK